jgi:hypothetical protein
MRTCELGEPRQGEAPQKLPFDRTCRIATYQALSDGQVTQLNTMFFHMNETHDLNLFSAWGLWFGNHLDEQATMYGIKMLTWSRTGKILQFLGAAMIVVDIIGPKKLRAWAAMLGKIRSIRLGLTAIVRLKIRSVVYVAVLALALFLLATVVFYQFPSFDPNGYVISSEVNNVIRNIWGVFFTTIYVCLFFLAATFLVLSFLEQYVMIPVAEFLSSGAPAEVARIVSLMLLIIGVHFDLLTS